jgi:hypothetical protein
MRAWRAVVVVVVMPNMENSSLVHQSSLAILPAETSESEQKKWTKE